MAALTPAFCLRGHATAVTALQFLPSFNVVKTLASGSSDGSLIIWNLNTRLADTRITADPEYPIREILCPNASLSRNDVDHNCGPILLITQSSRGVLSLWDLSRSPSTTESVSPVSSILTDTQSYAKAFIMDLSDSGSLAGSVYCVSPISNNRSMGLFDLNRSAKCSLKLGEIKTSKKSHLSDSVISSLNDGPGWVVGGSTLPFINPFTCILAYQYFGVQAVFDIRYPDRPVFEPLLLNDVARIEEIVSFAATRETSWIGTADGFVLASRIDDSGKIQPTHRIDFFPECRDSHATQSKNDLLGLKQQEACLIKYRRKLGIGAIKFHSNSRLAAVGCWDNTVRLFDVNANKPLELLKFHTDSINEIAFDFSSEAFAVGSKDTRISCWIRA